MLLVFFESASHFLMVHFIDFPFEECVSGTYTSILIGWPHTIMMFLTAFVLWKKEIKFSNQ